jgi:hypothetical protein
MIALVNKSLAVCPPGIMPVKAHSLNCSTCVSNQHALYLPPNNESNPYHISINHNRLDHLHFQIINHHPVLEGGVGGAPGLKVPAV